MIYAIGLVHFAKLTFLWNPGHSGMPTVRTAKHLLLESTTKSVESGTYDVICHFCTVKGMVVESEVLKAQSYALSKLSFPMHSNVNLDKVAVIVDKRQNLLLSSSLSYFWFKRQFPNTVELSKLV